MSTFQIKVTTVKPSNSALSVRFWEIKSYKNGYPEFSKIVDTDERGNY